MIDIVKFNVDEKDPWVKKLGFNKFVYYKNLNVVSGGDENTNLKAVKNKNVDILMSPETSKGKDHLHYRHSGLNQVLMKWAKKNNVAIGFAISNILHQESEKRTKTIGRMMQNVILCRKYKIKMVLCSFAKDTWELRNASDIISFGRVIHMTPKEAKEALNLTRREKGIRIVKE